MRQLKILSRVGTTDLTLSQEVRKDLATDPLPADKQDRGGEAGQHSDHQQDRLLGEQLGAAGGEKGKNEAYLTEPTGAQNEVFFYFITFRIRL